MKLVTSIVWVYLIFISLTFASKMKIGYTADICGDYTSCDGCINDIGCQGITYYKNMESMVHIVSGVSIFL